VSQFRIYQVLSVSNMLFSNQLAIISRLALIQDPTSTYSIISKY